MNSLEIRKKFFDYFIAKGHTQVPSSSLIPAQDPTLLFANAGMNQFKDVFLGKETRSYKRAVSIQKCIRAGGKHNDLDNVGFTARHLTFFEMMGNFSFGDYFKKEAIQYAWEFLTKEVKLDASKLHASVYRLDDDAYNIWNKEIGLPESKIHRLGEADNFWQMGDTGPCGPCTEIYIDRGTTFGCKTPTCSPGCSCDRFLEIWNLVFMQFDRQSDGQDVPLKNKGVDTGMGLERLCSVIQNKESVFDIDLFEPIIKQIEKLTGKNYEKSAGEIKAAFRVLADHIRSSCFAIADGCTPSNEGRGYVLRKIIRRAALFAQKLTDQADRNIFPALADSLIEKMGKIYPELEVSKKFIKSLLESEIEKFSANLISGQAILKKYFAENQKIKTISGAQAFKLYDTYGFPLELTKLIAQENKFTVDTDGFEVEMEKQREHSGKKQTVASELKLDEKIVTKFTGYEELESESKIISIIKNNGSVNSATEGDEVFIIAERTPFYVECGGQVNDQGTIIIDGKLAKLLDLKKFGNAIGMKLKTPKGLKIGDTIKMIVDKESRLNTMKNHTATHLLQSALIGLLGKQVKQSGSVVNPDYLRFDFTYHENLTQDQIEQIEMTVNRKIMENIPVAISTTTYKNAVDQGVIAFFGEKYNPENVRVVAVEGFSKELCGGTHVTRTGDIGAFKITEIGALSAGNKRIVALTGPGAIKLFQEEFAIVKNLCQEFKVTSDKIISTVEKQKETIRALTNDLKQFKKKFTANKINEWEKAVVTIGHIPFLYINLEDYTNEEMKDIVADLQKIKPGFYFITSKNNDKTIFIAQINQIYKAIISLPDFAQWLKENYKLHSGGSEFIIQGGGTIPNELHSAIKNYLGKIQETK